MYSRTKIVSLALILILTVCIIGYLENEKASYPGISERFTQNELKNAASCLKKENAEFKKIWYDEKISDAVLSASGREEVSDNAFAMLSNFKKDGVSYYNYVWIMERDNSFDNWKVKESFELKE